jgi:polyphosphate kinase
MLSILVERLKLSENDVYALPYMLDPSSLTQFSLGFDRDDLRDPEWVPIVPECFKSDESMFHIVREADRIVHHPYESFEPVLKFLRDAASDPDVLAVKITLYRTSGGSPVVQALKEAAERGIQVTAFVELKARFDEERNINWAQELERVGVIVVHGIANLKVHAKACMVIRRERDGIRRYVHLSTGNYNDRTARLYSDIGLFTASEAVATDIAHFFNAITGYSSVSAFKHIAMAPVSLKSRLIELIGREIARKRETGIGRILVKLNSVGDPDVIEALYDASCAGVEIRMNVRGTCMLVPGVEGISDHIEVTSIVDRYLEHSRILYFENGGSPEIYLSSADWMPRNLERRIELLFPVTAPEPMARLYSVLTTCFDDNVKAHHMQPDGSFVKAPANDAEPKRAQEQLRREASVRADNIDPSVSREFTVRRSGRH